MTALRHVNYALRPATIDNAPVEHHRRLGEKELRTFWRSVGDQGAHTKTIAATRLLLHKP